MSVVSTVDITVEDFTYNRPEWLHTNITLSVLSPLYPEITTEADVDAAISSLLIEEDPNWWITTFPGCTDVANSSWQDGNIMRAQSVKTFVDMTSLDNCVNAYPFLPNYDLYRLDGKNLVQLSDQSVVSVLTPKEYCRWAWTLVAKIKTTRQIPVTI